MTLASSESDFALDITEQLMVGWFMISKNETEMFCIVLSI